MPVAPCVCWFGEKGGGCNMSEHLGIGVLIINVGSKMVLSISKMMLSHISS